MVAHLEKFIQSEIKEWLDNHGYLVWRNFNIPTRGRGNLVARGLPDLFFMRGGVLCGVEVKTKDGKLSEHQIAWGDKLVMHGGHYFVVTSLKELLDCIDTNFGSL